MHEPYYHKFLRWIDGCHKKRLFFILRRISYYRKEFWEFEILDIETGAPEIRFVTDFRHCADAIADFYPNREVVRVTEINISDWSNNPQRVYEYFMLRHGLAMRKGNDLIKTPPSEFGLNLETGPEFPISSWDLI